MTANSLRNFKLKRNSGKLIVSNESRGNGERNSTFDGLLNAQLLSLCKKNMTKVRENMHHYFEAEGGTDFEDGLVGTV